MEEFQRDLEKLYQWQDKHNMVFNGAKFENIRYGENEELKNTCDYLTPDAEDIIERKECVRDLGIKMNDKADFKDHINFVCSKVNQKSGWILRTFMRRNASFMKFMWKTYIQGHIDYCSQLWQPIQGGLLQRVEGLQQSFTKKIPQVSHLNYWERLSELKLSSQQRRLERYRIIYIWKILEGKVPNCGIKSNKNIHRGRMCNLPPISKHARQVVKSLREQTLQVHGSKLFNKLPCYLRDETNCSVEVFKENLDLFLKNIPDQPMVVGLTPSPCNLATGRASNSLLEWIPLLHKDTRRNRHKG